MSRVVSIREIWSAFDEDARLCNRNIAFAYGSAYEEVRGKLLRDERKCEGVWLATDFDEDGTPAVVWRKDLAVLVLHFTLRRVGDSDFFSAQRSVCAELDYDDEGSQDREEEDEKSDQTFHTTDDAKAKGGFRVYASPLACTYENFYANTLNLLKTSTVPVYDPHGLLPGKRVRRVDRSIFYA